MGGRVLTEEGTPLGAGGNPVGCAAALRDTQTTAKPATRTRKTGILCLPPSPRSHGGKLSPTPPAPPCPRPLPAYSMCPSALSRMMSVWYCPGNQVGIPQPPPVEKELL